VRRVVLAERSSLQEHRPERMKIMLAAGFSGPSRMPVAAHIYERAEDEIVASVFSLSSAAPHLFGERRVACCFRD
jgi:hypothetical protein